MAKGVCGAAVAGTRLAVHDDMSSHRLPPWEHIARASQLSAMASLSSLDELRQAFRNDRTRYRLLERLRWPGGFVCARCEDRAEPRRPHAGMLTCARCGAFHEVTGSGPIDPKVAPISRWLDLLWLFVDRKVTLEPSAVAELLGCHLSEANRLVRGLWRAVEHAERQRLGGDVEVDARVVVSRGAHFIVLLAAERRAEGSGRVRARVVDTVRAEVVQELIADAVEVGSTLHTDCWSSYLALDDLPYHHQPQLTAPQEGLPTIDGAAAMLQRWLRKEHSAASGGAAGAVAEFVMRFNRVRSSTRGELLCVLLASALLLGQRSSQRRISGVRRIQLPSREAIEREAAG